MLVPPDRWVLKSLNKTIKARRSGGFLYNDPMEHPENTQPPLSQELALTPSLRLSLDERLATIRLLLDAHRLSINDALEAHTVINEELMMLQSFSEVDSTLYFQVTELSTRLQKYIEAHSGL